MKLFEELEYRGLVNDITNPDLIEKINSGGLTFYIGVDPTGDSLHIGHYQSVIAMTKRLMDNGHKPIIIAGGGTGLIGDPKPNVERPMISKEQVKHNIECIQKQISKIMGKEITIVNNADWLLEMNAIDFLRDYGKYFNINYMINKDTVKRRLDIGITYTEFSYMLLQSIDFLKLYENHGVTLQIGGQDQWGNITAGIELIRKLHSKECYGLTIPLVTKADGTKFGKSESGEALWLDINKTSAYEMYQYLINVEDVKVIEYLKRLTFLSKEEIEKLEESNKTEPEKRIAHKALAKEIITFIHGEEEYNSAKEISNALFSGKVSELTDKQIEEAFKGVPKFKLEEETPLIDVLVNNKIASSRREAREFLNNNAITLNGEVINEENHIIKNNRKYNIIRRGKKKYYLLEK